MIKVPILKPKKKGLFMKQFTIAVLLGAFTFAGSMRAQSVKGPGELKQAVASKKPIVAKFGAKWCPACVRAHSPFEQLAAENPDVVFVDVDVDENKALSDQYHVQSLPTFVFLKNGQKVGEEVGYSLPRLKEKVASLQGASAPQDQERGKKKEELKEETEGGSCAAGQEEGFFQRAYNATRDFFISLREKIHSWFQ